MSDIISNSDYYMSYKLHNFEDICKLVKSNNHLYLFNEGLSDVNQYVYIDATFGIDINDASIVIMNFPRENDTKPTVACRITPKSFEEDYFAVMIGDEVAKDMIKLIKDRKKNPTVKFSNGNIIKQNYLRTYPICPVRYQITINNRYERKDNGTVINYEGTVRIEHYTCWKQIFTDYFDSYEDAFKKCEKVIEDHIMLHPTYDNE